MTPEEIKRLLDVVGGRDQDEEWRAVSQLRTLGPELAKLLHARFRVARSWKVRRACVYYSLAYATASDDAFALGLAAIRDRAKGVRYRGAMLLAFSQRSDAVPALRAALASLPPGDESADDMAAAIDAIQSGNHNFFADRHHTGKITIVLP